MPGRGELAVHTVPIGALRDVAQLMQTLQHDPWPLLTVHGIDRESLATPRSPVPATLVGQVLQAAAVETHCPHFGLLVGEAATLENVGELRFLALNASTARQAMDHLARFISLLHQILRVTVRHDQRYTFFTLTLVDEIPGAEQILLAYMASAVGALRSVIGGKWNPSMVHLALRKPSVVEPYKRFFGAPVLFDQPEYAIAFPDEALNRPSRSADPRLAELIFERLCALEAQNPSGLVEQVRHAIERQLLCGGCNVVNVAKMFSVHRKTLHDYLSQYDTSFEQLLDETRRTMADRMLEHTDLPLAEIATTLCYSNQAGLTRAFRRWHDESPSAWRRRKATGTAATRRAAKRYQAGARSRR
ncbi:MAG: AraC family transcriptional regulator [Halioglobus sp.]|nr:AraC family transcriptional regulator [Halioglobus sp.]MBP6723614.1 AraC family transcriptional regulator [Halioglobus sp.]